MAARDVRESAIEALDDGEILELRDIKAQQRGEGVGCQIRDLVARSEGISPGTDLEVAYHPESGTYLVRRKEDDA